MAKKTARKKAAPPAAGEDPTLQQISAVVECPLFDSFKVQQVAGMFDVTPAEKLREQFDVQIPQLAGDWQIGIIVGPSGSGKSTIARQAFGERLYAGGDWPTDRAIVDCFGDVPTKEVTAMLTAVGFSSPPSWIKPYHVLSNGEKFRCDLARALLSADAGERAKGCCAQGKGKISEESPSAPSTQAPAPRLVVFDEFTSVVDRQVAKVGSAAVSKQVRRSEGLKFVAVACHYDMVEWLEPDWVLDMASRTLARGRLRRPQLHLEIYRAGRAAWGVFKKHHYLSGNVPAGSRFYVALCEGQPCGLVATANAFGAKRPTRRISRIVVLPDYQGIGIGGRMLDAVAGILQAESGVRVQITSAHPSMIHLLKRSANWRIVSISKNGNSTMRNKLEGGRIVSCTRGRAMVTALYLPPAPSGT